MSGPYRASTVANEFFRLAQESGRPLTPMQYVKLTYIAHGWSLALRGSPLISEPVEAWKFGPVIPHLYQRLKHYGAGPVTAPIGDALWAPAEALDEDTRGLLRGVFEKYGSLNGIQLSHLTHKPGTPWSAVYDPEGWGEQIPDSLIREHYTNLSDRAA
ncbi:Panacea domain-containing protein [Brevundimonas sp.]|uniref:Panacea domain-containing protein n=1 Tax=Brevundimonas sp. TaxID=1871086 RepID=UPI003F6EFEC3